MRPLPVTQRYFRPLTVVHLASRREITAVVHTRKEVGLGLALSPAPPPFHDGVAQTRPF